MRVVHYQLISVMRRIPRVDRHLQLYSTNSIFWPISAFRCANCRLSAFNTISTATFSTSSLLSADNQSTSITEKLRRKIWGTDKPPGPEDPYSGKSVFDRIREKRGGKKRNKETSPSKNIGYVEATTWDGLEWIGGPDEGPKIDWNSKLKR